MALFTETTLRNAAREYRFSENYRVAKSADALLSEAATTYQTSFDVFLSHSIKDAELVLGAYRILVGRGFKVYVDWLVDPTMDRSRVTSETAEKLRQRMRQSSSLVYMQSAESVNSKWMPWELGYFDGYRSAVAIWPIVYMTQDAFVGQEYLGLYPWVDGSALNLWVNKGSAPERLFRGTTYKSFGVWLDEQRRAA